MISLLDAVGALEAAMIARKYVRLPFLPIVTYHRLGDPDRDARYLDESVVDATKEGFERQVELMMRRFTLLSVEDLRQFFFEKKPLPKNPALITFDDGYKACHDIALPVLKRAGARAVFFISTGHMSDRKTFWWDRANYLIKKSKKNRIEIDYPKHKVYDLAKNRNDAITDILDTIKLTFGLDVERYLEVLGKALDVPWGPEQEKEITDEVLMTWDQVRTLSKEGMDVESHTHTHRVLTTLAESELKDELVGSKNLLEEQLDQPIRALAYPVSLSIAKHNHILDAVKEAGYDLGFSTSCGLGPLGPKTHPLDIQRFWVDPTLPHSYFRAALAMPQLTYRRR
ncbi:MAG: polysaccharide deacetylase family protein [Labilithrix sp.]|nr:polysaccharide deacetylase family protein [Labilithrix sp.]